MQQTIVICACSGDSLTGRITMLAAQELVLEGKATWYCQQNVPSEKEDYSTGRDKCHIAVHGCEKQCLLQKAPAKDEVKIQDLTITDLGIDPASDGDITRSDIELVKDAIVAACTPVEPLKAL